MILFDFLYVYNLMMMSLYNLRMKDLIIFKLIIIF